MTDEATLATVVEYVDEQRSRSGVPGVAIAIVAGDEVRVATGLGRDSAGRPITDGTVFLINSLSKSITATALMQLVDAGQVDLDAPVATYVQELSPGGSTVTVRDVMHHRSGIAGELHPRPAQHDLDALAGVGPFLTPGADYRYTNLNYDLLALIVERVSGESFADYVTGSVFGPLQMHDSAVGTDRARALEPTDGHYKWLLLGYRPMEDVGQGQVGSAAMYSTANDMANYLIAHMNGGVLGGTELLSDAAIASLHEATPIDTDAPRGYGGGLFVAPGTAVGESSTALGRHRTVWHDGRSFGFRSFMWMTLGPDVGMVILANGNDVTNDQWIEQLASGTRSLLSGEPPPDVGSNQDLLTRWSKHLYLALALLQLLLLLLVIPVLRRMRNGQRPTTRQWTLLGAVSLIDIGAAVLVFVVTPAITDAPLAFVMGFPDYRILLWSIIALIGAGIARTLLAGWWAQRRRSQRSLRG